MKDLLDAAPAMPSHAIMAFDVYVDLTMTNVCPYPVIALMRNQGGPLQNKKRKFVRYRRRLRKAIAAQLHRELRRTT